MNGTALLEFLREIRDVRAPLAKVLQADLQREFVYYICPLTNLKRVSVDGILPHAIAPADRTDLSGQNVQALRDIDVVLTNNFETYRESEVHKCVNCFWNPLNWTFWTFQRHALLKEAATNNADDGVVCVLEISLDRLVTMPECFWTLAPRNMAGSGFANFTPEFFTNKRPSRDGGLMFDWKQIFSVAKNETDRAVNRKRAAEFIYFRADESQTPASASLPFNLVERIIVPSEAVRRLTDDQKGFLNSTNKKITALATNENVEVFATRDKLLWPEEKFVKSLIHRLKSDDKAVDKLNAAIHTIADFEQRHPELNLTVDKFLNNRAADGPHGILHIARVMFWAAYIAHHLPEKDRDELMPVVLGAVAIHDLCRETDHEDELHGTVAAERYADVINKALAHDQKVKQCLEAVQLHCVPDDRCRDPNLVWQILKDADALDRGRFKNPKDPQGCNPKFFRTEVLRSGDPYNNIAWMAHYLAHMTRYMPVDQTPCQNLCRAIHDGVEAYVKQTK